LVFFLCVLCPICHLLFFSSSLVLFFSAIFYSQSLPWLKKRVPFPPARTFPVKSFRAFFLFPSVFDNFRPLWLLYSTFDVFLRCQFTLLGVSLSFCLPHFSLRAGKHGSPCSANLLMCPVCLRRTSSRTQEFCVLCFFLPLLFLFSVGESYGCKSPFPFFCPFFCVLSAFFLEWFPVWPSFPFWSWRLFLSPSSAHTLASSRVLFAYVRQYISVSLPSLHFYFFLQKNTVGSSPAF